MKYLEIVALLLLALTFSFQGARKVQNDTFFNQTPWSVIEVVFLLIVLTLFDGLVYLLLKPNGGKTFFVWMFLSIYQLPILILILYFRGQSPRSFGLLGRNSCYPMAQALKWVFCILTLLWTFGSLLPSNEFQAVFGQGGDLGFRSYVEHKGALSGAAIFFGEALWIAITVSIVEELKYRGLLYAAIRKHASSRLAIVLSAICFSMAHSDSYALGFLFGTLSAWLFERYHSLVPAIVVHFMWDLSRYVDRWFVAVVNVTPQTYFLGAAIISIIGFVLAHGLSILTRRSSPPCDNIGVRPDT